MAKMFKQAGTAMNIESRYVEGKARGFKHNAEVHDQLAILKIQKNEVSVMKRCHKNLTNDYKKVLDINEKAAKEFIFYITEGRQNPKLGTVYNMYGDYLTKTNDIRSQSLTQFNLINEEWRSLSRTDLKNIETKLDQANKALVTRQYYESNKDPHNAKEWDGKYYSFIIDFVRLLHELREKKETLHPQFLLRSLQAELIMVRALVRECDMVSAAVLQFGPVDPIRVEPFRLIPRDPYPMSEEEKKKLSGEVNKNPYANSGGATGSNPYGQPVQTTVVTQTYAQPLPVPMVVPVVQPMFVGRCQALYQFNASSPQELPFNVGDILNLINVDGAWWRAELHGREGLIPSNYVQRI